MSTTSVCSEDSESSTVYHSCREGDASTSSEADVASFRSFSTRSISTLNSYQSALSYLSSGTGYLSALDVEDDARTLQGDEFGGDFELARPDSDCSTPTPVPSLHPEYRMRRSSELSLSSTGTLENDEPCETSTGVNHDEPNAKEVVRQSDYCVAPLAVTESTSANCESGIKSVESPANCLEKSTISTATQIEVPLSAERSLSPVQIPKIERELPFERQSYVEVPSPRHIFPELPSSPGGDCHSAAGGGTSFGTEPTSVPRWLFDWKGSLLLTLITAFLTTIELLLHWGMEDDPSWWKLIMIRAIFQCTISSSVIIARHIFTENRVQFKCTTFSLTSHRWIYFCQAMLSFVFVASTLEAVQIVPATTLATCFNLLPVVIIAADVAKARATPNFMCYLSTILLVACSFMLTWPPSCVPDGSSDTCLPQGEVVNGNQTSWTLPFFNADLIFGWPIDPRNYQTQIANNVTNANLPDSIDNATFLLTQMVLIVLSMVCPIGSLLLMDKRSTLDPVRVVLCQGIGTLLFCIIDTRVHSALWYEDESLFISNIIIALLGVALNFLLVILVTHKGSPSIIDSEEVCCRQNRSPQRYLPLSSAHHLPTAITLIVATQLLISSLVNFVWLFDSFCCSALDVLGVILTSCLIVMVGLVGLQPQRNLRDLNFLIIKSELLNSANATGDH